MYQGEFIRGDRNSTTDIAMQKPPKTQNVNEILTFTGEL